MKDLLELKTRRDIFELVSDQPGIHLSKIAKTLEMNVSLVEYHLRFLEKNKLIKSIKEEGFKRYFPRKEKVESKEKLSELRKEVPLKIVLVLLKEGNMTHKELLKEVDISASTLSYHLKKLEEKDILVSKRYGKNKGYKVKDRKEIIQLLVKYEPHDILEGFADIWTDLRI